MKELLMSKSKIIDVKKQNNTTQKKTVMTKVIKLKKQLAFVPECICKSSLDKVSA